MSVELFNGATGLKLNSAGLWVPQGAHGHALREGRACQDNDVLRTLVYNDERRAWEP